jgi:hypothetical protein
LFLPPLPVLLGRHVLSGREAAAAPKTYLADLQAAASLLTLRHGFTVVVDPAIQVDKPVPPVNEREDFETALRTLASKCRDAGLRRLYLMRARSAPPDAAKLAAATRALEAIDMGPLVISKGESATTFTKESPLPEATRDADLIAQGFDPKPVYLLYAKTEPVKTWDECNAELQRQALECMLKMSPEKLMDEMAKGIEVARSLPAKDRWRVMGLPVMAGMFATWFPRAAKEKAERGMP